MRAKFYLMTSLIVSCAWGSITAFGAEGVTMITAPSLSTEKPSERISLQSLKNLRDPFKRIGLDIPDAHDDKAKSELETVPVSEFKMVGVLTGPYKTRALVRSPSGSVYTVSDGTRIGPQNGYVRKVLRDRIIVNEVLQDVLGEKELVTSELKLTTKGVEKGVSSVQALVSTHSASHKGEGGKDGAKDGADPVSSNKAEDLKPSAPVPAAPAASAPAPKATTAASAPAPKATTAAAATSGNSFTVPVPPPLALPQTNSLQQTAGSK